MRTYPWRISVRRRRLHCWSGSSLLPRLKWARKRPHLSMSEKFMTKEVASWKQALEVAAATASDAAVADVTTISTKAGMLTLGDKQFPGNKVQCIPVAYVVEKAYYDQAYDADKIVSPKCFAISDSAERMEPHDNVKEPQAHNCAECEWAKFGTAAQGKGPACKTRIKLALISASDNPSPEEIGRAKMVTIKSPPTSAKNWYQYLGMLGSKGLAPWCMVSEISTQPSKFMFSMNFAAVNQLRDEAQLAAAYARAQEGEKFLQDDVWEEDEEPAPLDKSAKFAKK